MNRHRRKNGRRARDRERLSRMNHGVMACATHESTDRLARRRLPRNQAVAYCVSVRNTCGCGDAQSRGNAARMYSRSTSRSGRTPSERAASAGLPRPSSGRSSTSIRTPVAKAPALSIAFSNSLMFPGHVSDCLHFVDHAQSSVLKSWTTPDGLPSFRKLHCLQIVDRAIGARGVWSLMLLQNGCVCRPATGEADSQCGKEDTTKTRSKSVHEMRAVVYEMRATTI